MCNRLCFQAQIMINRYFTHMNTQRDIWKCRTWEKFLQGQPCPSHYKTPCLKETGPLNASSTIQSTAAPRKHTPRFPALAWGASAAALKTTTPDKPLALQAQLASGVRQELGGAKETRGGCTAEWVRLSEGSATRSHHRPLPAVPGPWGAPQRKETTGFFLWNLLSQNIGKHISDHNNLSAG